MSDENNEVQPTSNEEENEGKSEAPRAKTPLERVREGQARMRGQKPASGRASNEGDGSGAVNSYKRRLHQRKSG